MTILICYLQFALTIVCWFNLKSPTNPYLCDIRKVKVEYQNLMCIWRHLKQNRMLSPFVCIRWNANRRISIEVKVPNINIDSLYRRATSVITRQ